MLGKLIFWNETVNPSQVIAKKRDGQSLSCEEIKAFVDGYVAGDIPDYQMSALAMAIYFRGMDLAETVALTECMLHSGVTLAWSSSSPWKVDKHSTGGVGDKVSLVLAPLVACCGLHVPMISGRGLGPTGGTLDKMESISGFRTDLTTREIQNITEQVGCVITGATEQIAPADKSLYALRDVTATVASIPLITASILSKKLAENLQALVLDVKFGSGAFMKSVEGARQLAQSLVAVSSRMGVATSALVTNMNQPLGRMVGNAVEVNESIAALSGDGPADLMALVEALAGEMVMAAGVTSTSDAARQLVRQQLESGRALDKFREFVTAQSGDLDAPRPVAPASECVALRAGYVTSIDSEILGLALIDLGGGRRKKSDRIDHSVGLKMLVRTGDPVEKGQPLILIFAQPTDADKIRPRIDASLMIGPRPPKPGPMIVDRIV